MSSDTTVYLNIQPHSLTISENLRRTYAFDREGRLITAFVDGKNYWRGLSGAVLLKEARDRAPKLRRPLTAAEAGALIDDIIAHVAQLRPQLRADPREDLSPWLDAILSWDETRRAAEQARFQSIYKPVSILPPDQYLSIVLQASEGCSWNRCTFCDFYKDRRFQIRSPDAFRQHVRNVKAFLGRGISLRKAVFLGDANALIIPQPRLIELIEEVHSELPIGDAHALKGIYAFLDIFGAEQKSAAQYAELYDYGVRRIYIGLESGAPEVFRLLNKPGAPSECVEAVRTIKSAGVHVGVILLAGAGGRQLAAQHVARSLDALAAMELGSGDLVYFSPLIVPEDSPYMRQARELGVDPMDASEISAQLADLKSEARRITRNGPRIALYHIEEFVY